MILLTIQLGNFLHLESSLLEFCSLEIPYLEFSYLLEASSYCINNHAIMQSNQVDQVDLNWSLLFILSCVEVFDLVEWSWGVFISFMVSDHLCKSLLIPFREIFSSWWFWSDFDRSRLWVNLCEDCSLKSLRGIGITIRRFKEAVFFSSKSDLNIVLSDLLLEVLWF